MKAKKKKKKPLTTQLSWGGLFVVVVVVVAKKLPKQTGQSGHATPAQTTQIKNVNKMSETNSLGLKVRGEGLRSVDESPVISPNRTGCRADNTSFPSNRNDTWYGPSVSAL